MPHWFANTLVVTEAELVPEFYSTEGYLRSKVSRDERRGFGLRAAQHGGNGRQLLVEFDSLPLPTQDAIGDPRKGMHVMEQFYVVDHEAVAFFQQPENGYSTDEHLSKQVTNASVMQAAAKLKEAHEATMIRLGKKPLKVMQMVAAETKTFNPVLKAKWGVEHSLPEEYRNLEKRMQRFAEERYHSLIHGLTGKKNAQKKDEYVDEILEAMFGGTGKKPSYSDVVSRWNGFVDGYVDVVKVIDKKTGECESYSPAGCKKLGRTTVYNFLSSWESRVGTAKLRSGNRQELMQEFKPSYKFTRPVHAGDIISVDDRCTTFHYSKTDRVWFYLGIDLASECYTVWVNDTGKEGMIKNFYRQMARNYLKWGVNIPHELECEMSLNSTLRADLLADGAMFARIKMEANNARGKRIERYFRDLRLIHEREEDAFVARPHARSENYQAGAEKPVIYSYDECVEMSEAILERWNNSPHSVETGMTRWEYFISKQNPQLRPTNWRGILPHIGNKTTTGVRAGTMRFRQDEYLLATDGQIATGDTLIELMTQVETKDVDIYWLDGEQGEVLKALVYVGDSYVCEALPKPRFPRAIIERTDAHEADMELMAKYVTTVTSYQNRRAKAVTRVEVLDNRPRTLNNKFQVIGKKTTPEAEWKEPEVMAEPEDDDEMAFVTVETSFKTSLKDRF